MYLYIYVCVFISNHVSTTSDAPNNTISVDMLDKIIEPIWLNCVGFFLMASEGLLGSTVDIPHI